MKPNFALSLSFDSISLLHRAAGGWREVGDVSFTADDLAGDLAVLRKTAVALEPAGVRCKLIIPDSQIRYLTLETPGLSRPARLKEAAKALEGATPYAVVDLVYDISQEGPLTHVAAVARETLEEAEAFALEHRFHPVSFVAVPGDADYLGEPFFGTTSAADDLLEPSDSVEADGIAVVVIGSVEPLPEIPTDAPAPAATPVDDGPQDAPDQSAAPQPDAAEADDEIKPEADALPADPAPEVATATAISAPSLPDAADYVAPDKAPPPPRPEVLSAGSAPRTPTISGARKVSAPPADDGANAFASQRAALGGASREAPRITPQPDSSSLTKPPVAADPSEAPAAVPPKEGFFSRRKPRKGAAAPVPAPSPDLPVAGTEAERMTVFGARTAQVGGKPRFLGLIMTVVLLIFLAGVAAWAAVFLDEGIAGLLRGNDGRATASAPENQIDPEVIRDADATDPSGTAPTGADTQVAALDPVLSAEDGAVLDARQDPRPEPVIPVITEQEAAARYAVSGIWPLAPANLPERPDVSAAAVYRNGIDGSSAAVDAIALPGPERFETDVALAPVVSPPPFGQQAGVRPDGLLIPTDTGIVTPQGYTLIAASPPVKPPLPPTRFSGQPDTAAPDALAPTPDAAPDTDQRPTQAVMRPVPRPPGLAETTQRAQLGGFTLSELAAFRPALRPRSVQDRAREADADAERRASEEARATEAATAAAAAALALPPAAPQQAAPALENATRLAVAQSRRPDTRPRNFDRIVNRARKAQPRQEETRVAAVAAPAPRTVAPKIPSKASVARSATVKNAINLRKVNLIGVYGKPSSRRALVRLSNGRYKKVRVGDRIDGGRVSAIGDTELQYRKGGRSVVLKMPKG